MTDLLPGVIPAEPTTLDMFNDPAAVMVAMVSQAKALLQQAYGLDGLAAVMEAKSRAEAIRVYVQQKDMGREAELAACEIVRRAERRIGELIREGQAEGTIYAHGSNTRDHVAADDMVKVQDVTGFAHRSNLSDVYAVTDDITPEQFEDALAEAKAEGNLSRANVVRKLKGTPAPKGKRENPYLHRTRHIDSNRVIRELVAMAPQHTDVMEFVDYGELDHDQIEAWVASLASSIRFLTSIKKNLTKEMTLNADYPDSADEEG